MDSRNKSEGKEKRMTHVSQTSLPLNKVNHLSGLHFSSLLYEQEEAGSNEKVKQFYVQRHSIEYQEKSLKRETD